MKSGTITHYIEIPVDIIYTAHPAERQTMTYPGCPAHVTVDAYDYPDDIKIEQIIDSHASEIREACEDDAKEG